MTLPINHCTFDQHAPSLYGGNPWVLRVGKTIETGAKTDKLHTKTDKVRIAIYFRAVGSVALCPIELPRIVGEAGILTLKATALLCQQYLSCASLLGTDFRGTLLSESCSFTPVYQALVHSGNTGA